MDRFRVAFFEVYEARKGITTIQRRKQACHTVLHTPVEEREDVRFQVLG